MADSCTDVLVEKNLSTLRYENETSLFLLEVMSREFYDRNSAQISGQYAGIGASWESMQDTASRLSSKYQFSLSRREALSALTMTSLPGAVDAWRACMQASKNGLFCSLEGDPSSPNFTLTVEWRPAPGLEELSQLRGAVARGDGAQQPLEGLPEKLGAGELSIIIDRRGPNPVRGVVHGTSAGGSYSIQFFAPFIAPRPEPILKEPYYLAKHPEILIRQGNVHGGLQLGGVYWQPRAIIGGVDYTGTAVGEHAPDQGVGYAEFAIPQGANYFTSVVGHARQDGVNNKQGNSVARVLVDGQVQWAANLVGDDTAAIAQTPNIGLPGTARLLRLEADSNGRHFSDHVTWGNPQFKSVAG